MIRRLWHRFLAYWRLSPTWVCELSRTLPPDRDYHDYPDSMTPSPLHFYDHTCRRCGKSFVI